MFKKITAAVMTVMMLCAFSICVFADMDAPPFKEIVHTVEDPDGITLYIGRWENDKNYMDYYSTAPYGTVIKITGEYMYDGKAYGSIYYNQEYLYVDMADLHLGGEFVYPSESEKTERKLKLVVIKKEGVALYNGPSYAYGKSVTVPYGTTLEYEYSTGTWSYVTYNGTKGWIYCYHYGESFNCASVREKQGKLMVVSKESVIRETPAFDSKVLVSEIPYGTVLTYKYEYYYPYNDKAYVEYNGVKGWIGEPVARERDCIQFVKDKAGLKIYAKAFDTGSVLGTIPYNTLFKSEYILFGDEHEENSKDWSYINYNGIKGWICSTYEQCGISYDISDYKSGSTLSVYSDRSTASKKLYDIKANSTFTIYLTDYIYDGYNSEEWCLVSNGEYYGWVYRSNDFTHIKTKAFDISLPKAVPIGEINKAEIITQATTEAPADAEETAPLLDETLTNEDQNGELNSKKSGLKISPAAIVVLCVATALIVAGAVVAIILIIKNSK